MPDATTGRALRNWYRRVRRPLPWRRDRNPYRVWVAEVLLQQTRVDQAVPYFERFVARFPTVRSLARATEVQILKVWEGAGYYARARNLGRSAREVVHRHRGALPRTVAELEELPGIGPYIARAVASLAFDVPVLAMETNGRRVAARWWAEGRDVRVPAIAHTLEEHLLELLRRGPPGEFNEALMELGETICLPAAPRCDRCPVSRTCQAYATLDSPGSIPTLPPRRPKPHVRAAVVIVQAGDKFLIQRRGPRGLLAGLYEFPGGKIEPGESPREGARRELEEEAGLREVGRLAALGLVRHGYSHFSVELHVYRARLARTRRIRPDHDRRWASIPEIRRLPLPKATEKVLDLVLRTDEGDAQYVRLRRRAARRRRGF